MSTATGFVAGRYANLEVIRNPFLTRARTSAKYTVPSLMPPEGTNGSADLPAPYQSLGARGVRNLSSKILLSLFPPNFPFFVYKIDDMNIEKATGTKGQRGEVEKALAARTRAVINEVEKSQFRPLAFEAVRQLLISGNALLYIPPESNAKLRIFTLDKYVVVRDPEGFLLEFITKEQVSPNTLTGDARALASQEGASEGDKATVDLYTHVKWDGENKQYIVYQEINGSVIPGSDGTYKEDKMPWIALRFTALDGEDYGRGYVEEFIGDLKSLEGLTKAMVEGAAISSKVVFFVKPNSTTKLKDVSSANNGDVKRGNADDITTLQVDKSHDLSVAKQQADELSQRLAFAFLLNTAIQRPGERVTAEEIRFMARELEDSLGGVYSLLSQEFQLPVVTLYELRMEKSRGAPKLPKGTAAPAIVTGIEALGRGNDLQNLDELLAGVAQIFGPEAIAKHVNAGEYLSRRAAALNVDTDGLIINQAEIAQDDQQAQLMELMQQLGPGVLKQAGANAGQQQAAPPQQEPVQ